MCVCVHVHVHPNARVRERERVCVCVSACVWVRFEDKSFIVCLEVFSEFARAA